MSLVDCQEASKRRAEEIARDIRLGKRPPPKSNVVPIRPLVEPPAVNIPVTQVAPAPVPKSPEAVEQIKSELGAHLAQIGDDLTVIPARTVILTACKYYQVGYLEIKSQQRHQSIVIPRHVSCYLLHELPNSRRSYPEIGRLMGDRDHTSVMFAVKKIARLIESDPLIAGDVAKLRELLESAHV